MAIGSKLTSLSDFLFRLLFKFLFRYDVFISYARRDGKDYALKLRDQLKALDFSCFLDFDELPAGNSLNKTLKRAIRKSATLIVIGTERAIKSRYVELEIGEFAKTNRAIIPIDIGGTLADPPWSVIKERDIVWIDETAESLAKGVPSPNVADSIDKLFKYTRRNTRVRGQVFATMLLFLLGAALAIFLIQGKVKALSVANVAAQEERQRAEDATAIAQERQKIAERAMDEAERQKTEASNQKKSAEEFAAKAEEEAKKALASARKAEAKEKEAKEKTREAEEQRRFSQARKLYADARNALDNTGEGLELSTLLSIESLKSAWTPNVYETWAQAMDILPDPTDDIRLEVEGAAHAIAFSPVASLVAIGSDRGLVLCNAKDGKRVNQVACEGPVNAVSFSRDGRLIAIGCGNKAMILAADNLKTIKTLPELSDELVDVIFSPDGQYLSMGGRDEKAHLFDTKNWKELSTPELEGGGRITSATFSLDSEWLILAGEKKLMMWGVKGTKRYAFLTDKGMVFDMAAGVPQIPGVPIALAMAGNDGRASLWSLKTSNDGKTYERAEKEHEFKMAGESSTRTVAFSPDGLFIASAGTDRTARIWDVKTGSERMRKVYSDEVHTIAFSPDGKLIATGGPNEARIWKVTNSKGVRRLEHTDAVLTSAFSPNSDVLATLSWDQMIRTFDTGNWKESRAAKIKFRASTLIFSPDGKWLASAGEGRVDVYDSITLNEVASKVFAVEGESADDARIVFSPDGRWLAAAYKKDLHLMATQSRQWVSPIEHKKSIVKIAFTADGQYVLTQTPPSNHRAVLVRPTMIRVWESATGKEVAWKSLEDEDENNQMVRPPVNARSKEDDFPAEKQGGQVALLSQINMLKELRSDRLDEVLSADGLWKAVKRMQGLPPLLKETLHDKTLAELKHDEYVNEIVFSPNSRWLVTSSRDHSIRVWPLTSKDMIDEACARLNRNLSDKEKGQYFSGERIGKTCPNRP